jgi:hypothetical protein
MRGKDHNEVFACMFCLSSLRFHPIEWWSIELMAERQEEEEEDEEEEEERLDSYSYYIGL